MSDTVVMKKKEAGPAQLVITLFAISAICAVLLGLVNSITMGPIEVATQAKTEAAMEAVLPADAYEPVEYTGGDPLVSKVYQAGDAGYVVQVSPSGFGGVLDVMVGVNTDAQGQEKIEPIYDFTVISQDELEISISGTENVYLMQRQG